MKRKINQSIVVFTIALISAFTIYFTGCSKKEETVKNGTGNTEKVAAKNEGKKLNVVSDESKLEWTGKKVTGQHNGIVEIANGNLSVDNGKLTGGEFGIDFTTIKVLDVKDPEMNGKLTNHLKSDDFFAASSYPIGNFVIKSLAPLSDGTQNNYTITGTLTIKGISKEITFPASVNINGEKVTASADFNIDRTLWDIKFRSGKFYENLGDNLISDEFNIKLSISAI